MSGALLMTAALAVPIVAVMVARRAALDPCREGRPPAFFAFALRVSWISIATMLVWIPVAMQAAFPALRGLDLPRGPALSAVGLVLLGPPLVLACGFGLAVHDVARRAGMTDWTWGTAVADALLQLVGAVAPVVLLLAAIDAARAMLFRESTIAAVAGLVLAATVARLRARASGLVPHAITSGPLRDGVFALAARAGVKLTQLYVVPFRRYRMANAFAVKGNVVILTDLLLRELGRDEVDAILAHEMAHLRRHDPEKIVWSLTAVLVAAFYAFPFGGWPLATAVALAGLFAQLALRRSIEFATDAHAIKLGAKTEAFVTGLARLNHLARVPLRWSRAAELFLTHPSTERRTRRVGERAGIDPAGVARMIEAPPAVGERYAVPAAVEGGRVFDSIFRRRVGARLVWTMLVVFTLLPALVMAALGPFGPVSRPLGIVLGALAAFVTWQCLWAFGAARAFGGIRARLAERLLGGEDPGATFVGLAPGDQPRIHEGFAQWDAGFVALRPGRLEYVGEEAHFALRADEIRDVRLDLALPGWIPVRAVRVRWARADGSCGAFGLLPAGLGSVFESRIEARRLCERIAAWQRSGGMAGAEWQAMAGEAADAPSVVPAGAAAVHAAPPDPAGVTSASPRTALAPRNLVMTVVVVWVMSLAATFLVGLPLHPLVRGVFDAWAASMVAYGLAIVPLATWRERPVAAAVAEPARRAA